MSEVEQGRDAKINEAFRSGRVASGFCVTNASIWTMEEPRVRAESLLVEHGRISAEGDERTIRAKANRRGLPSIDARGLTILPGLIDSHTHLVHQGLLRERPDLGETRSLEEAFRVVRRRLARHPGDRVLIAERWDESRWKEKRFPTGDELDTLSPVIPIIMRRVDGHFAVANRAACALIQGKLPGVDASTGHLVEEAALNLNQIFPTPLPDAVRSLEAAQSAALRYGVTAVHDFVVPSYLRAYQELHRRGGLRIRAHLSLYADYLDSVERLGLATGWGDPNLRLHGIKLFADGSFGGRTAALREPYADQPRSRGRLNYTSEALDGIFRRAQRAGLHISAHAIGDAAIDQVVAAFQRLPRAARRQRHAVEHFELPTSQAVDGALEAGAVASMQPNFVGAWSRRGGMYHARVGNERFRRTNEFHRLRRFGLPLAFGSDCMPFNPWFGLQSCVDAPYPAQRLPIEAAVDAYTRGSAWALGREGDLGQLTVGRRADFVVVDWKPHRRRAIHSARVAATFIEGRPEYERRPGQFRPR